MEFITLQLNYSGSEAMIDVPLSVVWDENKQLDSPDPITGR